MAKFLMNLGVLLLIGTAVAHKININNSNSQNADKCSQRPPVATNSRMHCDAHNTCTAECLPGFKYPDGTFTTSFNCKDGQYINTKSGLAKTPNCEPICTPECENGGVCITPGTCHCDREYRGDRCQYNIDVCNVKKVNFNGQYHCKYSKSEATCKFDCNSVDGEIKYISEGRLDIDYTCKYDQGEYLPKPYPKCIYPPGYTRVQK